MDKLLDMPLKDLMELVDVGIVSDFGHKGPCSSSLLLYMVFYVK